MVAASKPTSRLSSQSHFLYHLASSWGPWSAVWVLSLSSTKLIPRALTPGVHHRGIRSWVSAGRREAPRPNSVALPPRGNGPRLALKPFRRERAISRFDETLTPPHGSSPSFSTLVGSVLHGRLRPLQPAHG